MWKSVLLEQGDVIRPCAVPVSRSAPQSGGRPLAHTVDGQNGSFVKRRTIERAGRVRHMVIAKHNATGIDFQVILQVRFDPELLRQPYEHRLAPHVTGTWESAEGGEQNTLKLDKGFFIKDDIFQV